MPVGRCLLLVDVLQDLLALGQQVCLLVIFLTQLWSEGERVTHKNLLLCLKAFLLVLLRVVATTASTTTSTVTVIFETFAVELQATWVRAVARFVLVLCNLFPNFKNLVKILIVVFFFNFIQNLTCNLGFLNCWLMTFAEMVFLIFNFAVYLHLPLSFIRASYPLLLARWAVTVVGFGVAAGVAPVLL